MLPLLVAQDAPASKDATVNPAPVVSPPKAPVLSAVEVLFLSGYRLCGKVKKMDEKMLEIEYAGSPISMQVKTDRICSLYFGKEKNVRPATVMPDSLVFISGVDAIPCKVHEMTTDHLLVTTDYKENMLIPRDQVAYFTLDSSGPRDVFHGETVIDGTWMSAEQEQHYKDTGRYDQVLNDLKPFVDGENKGIQLNFPMPILAKNIGLDPRCFDFSVCLKWKEMNWRGSQGSATSLTFIFGAIAEKVLGGSPRNNMGMNSGASILLEVRSNAVLLVLSTGEKDAVLAKFELDEKASELNLNLSVRWGGMNQLNYEVRVNNDLPQVIKGVEGVPLGTGFCFFANGSPRVTMVNPRLSVQAGSFVGSEVQKKKGVLTKEEDFLPFEAESLSGDPLLISMKGAEEEGLKTIPARYVAQVVLNHPEKSLPLGEGLAELSLGDSSYLQGRVKEIKDGNLFFDHPYLGEIIIPANQINRLLMPQACPNLIKSKP